LVYYIVSPINTTAIGGEGKDYGTKEEG
jgi:hypothetical protein